MKVNDNKPLDIVVVQDMVDKNRSNVWLRKNIIEKLDADGNTMYEADEVFMEVTYKENLKSEIEANFETWWNFIESKNNDEKPKSIDERVGTVEVKTVTIEETLDVLLGGA